MASLMALVTSRMTPEVMQKLASLAGISLPNAKPAIDALILTQVYDLVSMGATEAGAHRLLGLLKEHRGTESFAHVLLGADTMQRQAKASDTLQAAVYGHDLSRRISSVAAAIGIPPGAASSLMGLLMSTGRGDMPFPPSTQERLCVGKSSMKSVGNGCLEQSCHSDWKHAAVVSHDQCAPGFGQLDERAAWCVPLPRVMPLHPRR